LPQFRAADTHGGPKIIYSLVVIKLH